MVATATDRVYGESSGVAVKAPVLAVATQPIPLVGLTPIGAYVPNPGDRILVTAQADATTNGIYNASVSAWQRSGDFSNSLSVVHGTLIVVGTQPIFFYQLTSPDPISIGTSPLNFVQQGAVSAIPGGSLVAPNLAALRGTTPTGGSENYAFVLGNGAPGDGGGGIYYYDATDHASADNGGTIIVSGDGGRWKLNNPWK